MCYRSPMQEKQKKKTGKRNCPRGLNGRNENALFAEAGKMHLVKFEARKINKEDTKTDNKGGSPKILFSRGFLSEKKNANESVTKVRGQQQVHWHKLTVLAQMEKK